MRPVGLEGCIWFFDKAAEVRVYYNSIGADICKRSEYRGELYRLLNFINALVFMECPNGSFYFRNAYGGNECV